MADRLRITARPTGKPGQIFYYYKGEYIGNSIYWGARFVKGPLIDRFIENHNLQAPSKPL